MEESNSLKNFANNLHQENPDIKFSFNIQWKNQNFVGHSIYKKKRKWCYDLIILKVFLTLVAAYLEFPLYETVKLYDPAFVGRNKNLK